MVLAPGRFSTITGWPSAGARRSASVRPTMSTALPGARVAMMRTVFVGHCCAEAMAEKNKSSAATSLVTRLLQENYVRRTELKNVFLGDEGDGRRVGLDEVLLVLAYQRHGGSGEQGAEVVGAGDIELHHGVELRLVAAGLGWQGKAHAAAQHRRLADEPLVQVGVGLQPVVLELSEREVLAADIGAHELDLARRLDQPVGIALLRDDLLFARDLDLARVVAQGGARFGGAAVIHGGHAGVLGVLVAVVRDGGDDFARRAPHFAMPFEPLLAKLRRQLVAAFRHADYFEGAHPGR